MSNVAYFSTWRPHGNRVSKTRFITLINVREEPREREREREKKKREKIETQAVHRARPGHAQAAHDQAPIWSSPIRSESLSLSLSLCCFLAVVKALNEIKVSLGWTILVEMEICRRGPASLAPLKTITESSPNCMILSLSLLEFSQFDEFYSNF